MKFFALILIALSFEALATERYEPPHQSPEHQDYSQTGNSTTLNCKDIGNVARKAAYNWGFVEQSAQTVLNNPKSTETQKKNATIAAGKAALASDETHANLMKCLN
jgi:hypothetical protein